MRSPRSDDAAATTRVGEPDEARRVAMFVLNPVRFDRRVLREAGTLATAGYAVSVYGIADAPASGIARERHRDGFTIVRVPMPGRSSLWHREQRPGPTSDLNGPSPLAARVRRPWGRLRMEHARWLINARRRWWAWGRDVIRDVGPAAVYHGHDLPGLGVAVGARRRYGGALVYDSHDLFVEAGANAGRPRMVRRAIRFLEGRWTREADLVITVNAGIAARLEKMYRPRRIAVIHNCVPRWEPPRESDDPLRAAIGVEANSSVVLYHGGFTANRGLGLLMRAMLARGLEHSHLVLLGYGPMEHELKRLAADPRYGGRVHVLPPVPPEDLDRWVSCADVSAMVNQPASLNEVLSTPNKLFESLAAGVPVVTSDFPIRRAIVLDDPRGQLGAVCDPTDVASIAEALRTVLSSSASARRELRERCLVAAHDLWNWEHEAGTLLSAYSELVDQPSIAASAPVSENAG